MERLREMLEQCTREGLYQIVVSNPRRKDGAWKLKIRPVMIGGELLYQESRFIETKVFHENKSAAQMTESVLLAMKTQFKQLEIHTKNWQATALVGKKGNVTIRKKNIRQDKMPELSHNRKKQYILEENVPVGFLQDLGVQTSDGKIVKSRYDKFRQINRFLELIEDILPSLPRKDGVRIIDFGCGKSYLTFAMYYYLKILKQYDVDIIGLDLKDDVIRNCNRLSEKYGYDKLHFYHGDIKNFTGTDQADMVVTLHACDTATDYALDKAVKWGAKVILSVPCCQHELNRQIDCTPLTDIFSYGLIKERTAALFTDALRAQMLEAQGYDTQILEFIDMEHTPKNIMIRAVRRKEGGEDAGEKAYRQAKKEKAAALIEFLHVQPTLEKLLQEL